jgi:hypothetical protein
VIGFIDVPARSSDMGRSAPPSHSPRADAMSQVIGMPFFDGCLIRGVYGGRTAAGDASRASGEVRSDPRRGRAVVKQNDKQTASRDDLSTAAEN